jgi:hypothetical protein
MAIDGAIRGPHMSRYEFKFVVSGEGVELSEADVEMIGQAVAQSGVTAVAEAEGTPEIPQSAILGLKKVWCGLLPPPLWEQVGGFAAAEIEAGRGEGGQ